MKVVLHLLAGLVTFAVVSNNARCQEHQLAGASPTFGPSIDQLEVSAEIIEIDNAKLRNSGIQLYPAMTSASANQIDSLKIADFLDRLEAASAADRLFMAKMPIKSDQQSYTRHDDHLLEVQAHTSGNETVMQVNAKSLDHQIERTFKITLPHEADQSIIVNPGWTSLQNDQDKSYCLLFQTSHSKRSLKATPVSMRRVNAQRYDISAKYFAIDRKAARKIGIDYSPGDQSSTPKATNGLSLRSFMILLQRHSIAKQTFFPLVSVDPNETSYIHLTEETGAIDCHLQSIVNDDASSIDITVTRRTPDKSASSVTYTLDASANKTYSLDINTLFDQANPNDIEHTVVISIDCVSQTGTN